MIKIKMMVGAFLLSLGLATALSESSFAVTANTTIANRPTTSDLQSAITRLESVGDYKILFKNGVTKLSESVDHADKYNYLRRLVDTTKWMIENYSLLSDQDLNNLLADVNDAIIGCKLLIGITKSESATATTIKTNTTATPAVTTKAQTTSTSTVATSAPAVDAKAQVAQVASAPTATIKTQVASTPITTLGTILAVNVVSESPADTSVTTPTTLSEATDEAPEEIAVPATGELDTPVSFNLLAVLGGVIVGGALLSVILTILIHRQPSRHRARR